ncbi:hypothetical protein HL667_30820 [Bradyrhizobium sp. 83012]|uniref:Uncharacterized protein n=1 Tax=Bradyrhizobium aeschynomenes TaxID=2734909 RepID=A0ABX2CNA8_9BRAD|nr:hypothetical protein [Bradyrhizobium aeschynomenes]NPU14425.1 hypothetical protein [Bradyrhizobium aeschynomenes]NPU69433.1 hypothetical protein [Bradyrhizobium aeschynomenes]
MKFRKREAEYFRPGDWTAQISLNAQPKSISARRLFSGGFDPWLRLPNARGRTQSPDGSRTERRIRDAPRPAGPVDGRHIM